MNSPDLTVLTFELFPTFDLRPDPRNPKKHPADQVEKIRNSIEEAGWGRPILANKRTGYIIAGHGAWQAAKELGMPQVPVIWTDMDPGKALLLMVADNRLAELAENDPAGLALVFEEMKLQYPEINITATGYTADEISRFILDGGEAQEDNYPAPEEYQAIKDPITKAGDLWILGRHRILCGDATDIRDVLNLMNGKTARLVVTDPPYNINYDQHLGGRHKDGNKMVPPKSSQTNFNILNDNMTAADFKIFLDKFMSNLFAVSDGPFYIFMACKEWPRIHAAFEQAGGHWSSTIIWNKSNHVLSRKDYQPKFEPILYGWAEEPAHVPEYQPILYGWRESATVPHLLERNKRDVWDFSKPGKSIDHPMMKPVELMAEPMKNSSGLGDIVLDVFLGSGSSLIAAEQIGRILYGLELDPKYCDVAVKRWEEATGKKAVRIPGPGSQAIWPAAPGDNTPQAQEARQRRNLEDLILEEEEAQA